MGQDRKPSKQGKEPAPLLWWAMLTLAVLAAAGLVGTHFWPQQTRLCGWCCLW
jgi:hypothetical protein